MILSVLEADTNLKLFIQKLLNKPIRPRNRLLSFPYSQFI